jgi:hypothetical protein
MRRVAGNRRVSSVDQKPIMPMRAGKKTFQTPAPHPSFDGWSMIGPNPPALTLIQISSAIAPTMTNGAAQFSKRRSVSIPRTMVAICSAQNSAKDSHCVQG